MTSSTGINPYKPPFRSPLGDVLSIFGHCQHDPRCRELELNVVSCTDVYGHKGLLKQCKDEYDDFIQCVYHKKEILRVEAMQRERMRQYVAGERTKKNLYAETPKMDSFNQTYGMTID